jgi:hypothetical protein
MRLSFSQVLLFLILFASMVISPAKSTAQYHDDDAAQIIDSTNSFCKNLYNIMLQTDVDFVAAKGSLLDTIGQKAWECKEKFKIPGSHRCTIYESNGVTTYVAFFIARESKDAVSASYNNLYHQIKDCLGVNYVYKEKKPSNTDLLMGRKVYECEMVPYGDATKEQAEMRISIQPNPAGNYELMLEMIKYKGLYTNRK